MPRPSHQFFKRILVDALKCLTVALVYTIASAVAAPLLGIQPQWNQALMTLMAGVLIGALLGSLAARVSGSLWRQVSMWASVLFFNTFSVAIEGMFFAPATSTMAPAPAAWIAFDLFVSVVTAALITLLFAPRASAMTSGASHTRAWYAWGWRFFLSALSYPVFYFIFGAINYALITHPYYETHAGSLTVPAPPVVLMAELVRAPLIVLAILPFILAVRMDQRRLALACGMLLFVVGGIVPLLSQTALPDLLRLASAVEILFQNSLTGIVAAALLAFPPQHENYGRMERAVQAL